MMPSAIILIADDEPAIAALLAAVLEGEGYRVRVAGDGAAALALAEREPPDLLITDEQMPRLTGTALIARLHARPGPPLPAILLSAAAWVAVPAGIAFLPKPFDLDRLLATVAALLAAR